MRNIVMIRTIVSILSIFSIVGCGSSSSTPQDNTSPTPPSAIEVAGPGGAFVGATEFTTEMIAGQSVYHPFDDNNDGIITNNEWLRVTFESNGDFLFNGEVDGSYIIMDGEIIVSNSEGDFTIKLNSAKATEWDVTFIEKDETKTWLLELKYNADMLVGKRFSVEFDPVVTVEYAETTGKAYDTDGNLIGEMEYVIKDGVLIHRPAEDADERYLMKIEADGSLLAWHPVESEADLFTFLGNI